MSACNRPVLLVPLICVFAALGLSQDSDVNGTVRDGSGKPLRGVWVYGLHHAPPPPDEIRVQTDDQGHFKLKAVGRPIFFISQNFQPLTYIRGDGEFSFAVTLNADTADHWPPACAKAPENGKRYGWPLQFLLPHGVKAHRVTSTDATSWTFRFRKSPRDEVLVIESGPLVGGFPPEDWLLNSKQFDEENSGGLDWKGVSPEGKQWRWFHGFESLAHYSNAPGPTAYLFDEIIESACMAPLPAHSQSQSN